MRCGGSSQAQQKPVVVSLGNVPASGRYTPVGSSKILANSTTITGSIGILPVKQTYQVFFRNMGSQRNSTNGVMPQTLSLYQPWTALQRQLVQRALTNMRSYFARVGTGRSHAIEGGQRMPQGGYSLGEALKQLVDQIGGLADAILISRNKRDWCRSRGR